MERILSRHGTSLNDTGLGAAAHRPGRPVRRAGPAVAGVRQLGATAAPGRFAGLVTLTAVLNGWGVLRLARAGSGGGLLFLGGRLRR